MNLTLLYLSLGIPKCYDLSPHLQKYHCLDVFVLFQCTFFQILDFKLPYIFYILPKIYYFSNIKYCLTCVQICITMCYDHVNLFSFNIIYFISCNILFGLPRGCNGKICLPVQETQKTPGLEWSPGMCVCVCVCVCDHLCPALCDPMDCSLLGFQGRKWQPIPIWLPGKFHGQKSPLAGYSPGGCKE